MLSCVFRRRRWWTRLKALDPKCNMSQNILADMLLDGSRLDWTERLMVLTSVGNKKEFDKVADAMVTQHPRVHEDEKSKRTFDADGERKPAFGKFRKPFRTFATTKTRIMTKAFVAHGDCSEVCDHDESEEESTDHEDGMTTYFCQSCGADDEFQDVTGRIIQDIVTAFFADAETEDVVEEHAAELYAQALHDEQLAFFSCENARAGGVKIAKHVHPYRPTSELSLDERMKRVDEVKQKST